MYFNFKLFADFIIFYYFLIFLLIFVIFLFIRLDDFKETLFKKIRAFKKFKKKLFTYGYGSSSRPHRS
jgi:hypothetical protein